jgi:AcrR family transcriptional regulator
MSMSQVAYLPVGKREQTKVQNRQAILDAAREVFGELGYETATVRDIIRRTDLSVGAFYNYFRSREEVFEALADDGAHRFRPILRACFETSDSFETYLRAAIQAYFDFIAAACIAIAREVGDKMLERRPVDTQGAADFAVTMILHGLKGLPKEG